MSGFAIPALIVATIIDFVFAWLLLTSIRRRVEHYWFAVLLLSVACWTLGVTVYLSLPLDSMFLAVWVREYYIAAATLALSLVGFSMYFPRRLQVKRWVYWVIGCAYAVVVASIALPGGLIGDAARDGTHDVELRPIWYGLYVLFFLVLAVAALRNLFMGQLDARAKRRRHLERQLRAIVLGSAGALAFGGWFNLILPLLGDYSYVWVGPLCTLIFVLTVIYSVVRQGLFDIRQALVRSGSYMLLFGGLTVLYSGVVYIANQMLFELYSQSIWGAIVVQMVLIGMVAVTVVPLKVWCDKIVLRVMYAQTYDDELVIVALRSLSQHEIKTRVLITRSLEVLAEAIKPHYATAYIYSNEGELITYNGGKKTPTVIQERTHREIVEAHIRELPHVGHVHDIDHLRHGVAFELLTATRTGAFVRLEAQGQIIGMIFLGRKINDSLYHDKDLQLFETIRGELALAVQNALRFREIERFTETLEQRVRTATRELRSSNEKLQQLDTAKDEFVSMASHQLRTPLTSVKGYISMVLDGDVGEITKDQRQLLQEAFTSSERMVHLIGDFLNVSRLQTGKFMIDTRAVNLAKIVEQEVEGIRQISATHGIKMKYKKPARFPELYLDENKIRQVIMNFMDNAIYYSPESKEVKISLSVEDGDAVLRVTDQGMGVPLEVQKKLFSKFFRAENARKQRPDGTGIGLYLARKIIVGHGGSLVFDSKEGKGSTFGFRLPVKKLSTAPPPQQLSQ